MKIENSMCHDIRTDAFEKELYDYEKYKSELKSEIVFGEVTYFSKKNYNFLQKKMLKIFFGFEIKDINH